jgi:hypothetical protein
VDYDIDKLYNVFFLNVNVSVSVSVSVIVFLAFFSTQDNFLSNLGIIKKIIKNESENKNKHFD